MPVSESEKLGVFVLGCHFSEKAEQIPIKKRRFLFKTSSPSRNTISPPLEGAERHETSPKLNSASNSNSSSLPATYETVTGICERGSKDNKLDKMDLVKDDDFSGISILAAVACSNSLVDETDSTPEVPKTVEFNENNVKNKPVFHTSTTPSKVDESALNKEPNIQNSPARDVRFSWDLNTVMDTREEPSVSEHEISNVEKKKVNSGSQTSPVEFNSLTHGNKLKVEKCELLSNESDNVQHAVVVKTEYLHDNHTNYANDSIPVTRTLLENPTHGIFPKCVGGMLAVDTKFSIDCSIPPGFDHCLNLHASKENDAPITQTAVIKHDLSLKTETYVKNGHKVEDDLVNKEKTDKIGSKVVVDDRPAATYSIYDVSHSDADNGFDHYNSQCDNRAGSGIGCDSQYEDGELREWTINDWKGYELAGCENECIMNKENSLDLDNVDAYETNIHSGPSVVLSGPKPNELTSGQHKSESQDNVEERASQSDEWKMNVYGRDLLPESRRINSNDLNKTRNFTGRKFSYREQKDKFGTEDVEMKGEGSRLYRKESPTRYVFLSRDRFQMQGHSSKEDDSLTYRPERESGASRSFRRGRYSPHNGPSDREGGVWNRSILEDSRTMGNLKNDGDNNIPLFVLRRTFRGRSPTDREVNEFRARLGLRPAEDTGLDSYVNRGRGRGRGRFMSYDTRGPARDECDEPMTEHSHFPRRRRCFSPIERRGNNSYQHHRSSSRSPSGFRRRSRSPGFRIRRPRSPGGYRDHPSECHYKERPVFNRSTPPRRTGGPRGERFSFYEGDRGGSMHVDDDGVRLNNNGYRGGGFGRRYNVDGPAKRFHYDDDDRCSRGFSIDARDRRALEVHARSSLKSGDDGTNSRFRDFPRRQREGSGGFRRRSRDGKDRKEESEHMIDGTERRPREVKGQSTTANHDSVVANEVAKESET